MYQVLYDYVCNEKVDIVTSRGYREYLWGTSENTLGDTIPSGKYKINEEGHYIFTGKKSLLMEPYGINFFEQILLEMY